MKKLLSIFLMISYLTVSNSWAWSQRQPLPIDQCKAHSPYGFPQTQNTQNTQTICRQGYLVGYDAQAKIPRYVTYTLLPDHALGCVVRSNAFETDQSVVQGATPSDYNGSGYDKGHQSPDGDQSWDQQVEYESFLMTNMAPQLPGFNRGTWKLLETSVRGWVVELNQPLTIYVGAVYNDQDKKIGHDVVVPHAFYKIVVNPQTREVAGWLFPHSGNLGTDLTKYRATVAQIQQQSGVEFQFPIGSQEIAPGKEWAVNFGVLEKDKKARCGANSKVD